MSAALVNRSLTTVRTELEFLLDSDVIDKPLFDTLVAALPQKYVKDAAPWGIDKIRLDAAPPLRESDSVTEALKNTSLEEKPPQQAPAIPQKPRNPLVGYCKASFNYEPQQEGDLSLRKDDKIAVVEHLSPDWWKGYRQGENPDKAGVFPSNYVTVISEAEFSLSQNERAPEKAQYSPESFSRPPAYQAPSNAPPSAPYGAYDDKKSYEQSPSHGYQAQQPSYGGYAQFPPPLTNYYAPQQQQPVQQPVQQQLAPPQQPVQQQHSGASEHFKKFGSKLGNAAIFGAGATIGSDIVNLIF